MLGMEISSGCGVPGRPESLLSRCSLVLGWTSMEASGVLGGLKEPPLLKMLGSE